MDYHPAPTYGDMIAMFYIDPIGRTCQPIMKVINPDGIQTTSDGGCNIQERTSGTASFCQMSDGTQWSCHQTTTITYLEDREDSPTTTTTTSQWYDQDGNAVDPPDPTG